MSARHTPGPWIGYKDKGVYVGEGLLNPVFETGCGCCTEKHLSAANARLIAAAPDLLEALIRLIATGLDQREHEEFMSNPAHYARAAIAKATGETK